MLRAAQATWDLSCSEHLRPGESYAAGAVRGLQEELGLAVPPAALVPVLAPFLQEFAYPQLGVTDREFVAVFRLDLAAAAAAAVAVNPAEVAGWDWVAAAAVAARLRAAPQTFAPWVADTLARIP